MFIMRTVHASLPATRYTPLMPLPLAEDEHTVSFRPPAQNTEDLVDSARFIDKAK